MQSNIYQPFEISAALGAKLPTPKGTRAYLAQATSNNGEILFEKIFNSEESAFAGLASFAIEQLEILDYIAPWNTIDYYERSKMSNSDFHTLSNQKMKKWLSDKSNEEIINAYWDNDISQESSWSVKVYIVE